MELKTNDISEKHHDPKSGVLYLVGTPIGNLGDFSPRAKHLLSNVSVIACEDTRYSGQFLKRFQIKSTLQSFHRHNTKEKIPKFLSMLKQGKSIALISDAGLPGISDPGEDLVSATKSSGHDVICIPGPCAATTALIISGLPTKRFCFEGFLPTKPKDRESIIKIISQEKRTTVIYESPHRLLKLLKELANACGDKRPLQVSRELTKLHEEQIGSTVSSVYKYFSVNKPKGEFTLVLGGCKDERQEKSQQELIKSMKVLLDKGLSKVDAAKTISRETGYSRNYLYSLFFENNHNNS